MERLWIIAFVIGIVQGCVHRDYGHGGTVCVCNAEHCDATEPLPPFQPRQFFLSISSKEGLRHNLTRKNFGVRNKSRAVEMEPWWMIVVLALRAVEGCVPRDFGNKGTVCVCNAQTCDPFEPLPELLSDQYSVTVSSEDGSRFQQTTATLQGEGKGLINAGITLTVDIDTTYQTILGFGGAITDSAGIAISSLSQGAQQNLLESYFGSNGSEYSLIRVPIGGTDFSTRAYSYNDDMSDDISQNNFNLTQEDFLYKVPYIQQALALSGDKPPQLFAAAWSPPKWMKTNNALNGVGYLKPEYYDSWTNYHLKFLKEYKKLGLNFWALSTGNEPIAGSIPFYKWNCLGWSPQAQGSWVANSLGPSIQASEFNETILIGLDDQRFMLPWWLDLMVQGNNASDYLKGIGVHWYWDNIIPPILLDKTREHFPDKFILSTEACFTPGTFSNAAVLLGSWARGEQYAESIMEDLNHWVGGWVDWNIALDEQGGPNWAENYVDSPIIVNKTADEFYKQPTYYAISHFSKFIPPGSVRVGLSGATKQVQAASFLTPDELITVVILNKRASEQSISITGCPRGIANFTVPKKSITSFVCRAKKPPIFKMMDD